MHPSYLYHDTNVLLRVDISGYKGSIPGAIEKWRTIEEINSQLLKLLRKIKKAEEQA